MDMVAPVASGPGALGCYGVDTGRTTSDNAGRCAGKGPG